MKYKASTLILTSLILFSLSLSTAQTKSKIRVSADVVSSFIWRGSPGYAQLSGQNVLSPSIQPTLAWTKGNFEAGAWGSSDFTGTFKELDLYASYTFKALTLTLTDYYWDPGWLTHNYFDYTADSTSHVLEAGLKYKCKRFPLSLVLATMFYGADKKPADLSKNCYSTYFELTYSLPVGENNLDFIFGMTPSDGFYGDGYGRDEGFAVVNLGLTGYRKIKINNDFTLPVKASLVANPQHQKAYLVFGFTI